MLYSKKIILFINYKMTFFYLMCSFEISVSFYNIDEKVCKILKEKENNKLNEALNRKINAKSN